MEYTDNALKEQIVVRQISTAIVWQQLKHGWADYKKTVSDCSLYGAIFMLMGYLLGLYTVDSPALFMSFLTIFLLVGPFLAIGLYDVARQLEIFNGQHVRLAHTFTAWRANMPAFSLYAVLLAVLVFGWFRISLLIFALMSESSAPTFNLLVVDLLQPSSLGFLVVYFLVGFFFAALVFAVSVVSIPMMLEKDVDAITAMVTSLRVVKANWWPMLFWAGIVVVLTIIGFVTYFIGLVIVMPIISLTTWHLYRTVVGYGH